MATWNEQMKPPFTSAHLKELIALRSRCLMIVDFAHEHSGLGELADEMRKVVENSYATQDLKGLRMVVRDLEEMADGLSPRTKAELDRRLEAELGIDMKAERAMDKLTIEAMVSRGKIRNEREYRMALAFLDSVAGTDDVAARLAPLVAAYGADVVE